MPFVSAERTSTWVIAEAVDYRRSVLSPEFTVSTWLLGILVPAHWFPWALIPNRPPEQAGPQLLSR